MTKKKIVKSLREFFMDFSAFFLVKSLANLSNYPLTFINILNQPSDVLSRPKFSVKFA